MNDFFSSPTFFFLVTTFVLASPVILLMIKWADKHIDEFITAHVANKNLANVLVRLNDTIWTLVSNAENTVVLDVKKKNGGQLTKEDGRQIKSDVMRQIQDLWGEEGLKELMDILGISTTSALSNYLGAKVETAVANQDKAVPNPLL